MNPIPYDGILSSEGRMYISTTEIVYYLKDQIRILGKAGGPDQPFLTFLPSVEERVEVLAEIGLDYFLLGIVYYRGEWLSAFYYDKGKFWITYRDKGDDIRAISLFIRTDDSNQEPIADEDIEKYTQLVRETIDCNNKRRDELIKLGYISENEGV